MIQVCFLTGVSPYNSGEMAGFPDDQAHNLVRRGVAEYVNPEDAPEPVVEEPKQAEPEPLSLLEKQAGVTEEMKAEASKAPEPVEDADPADLLSAKPDKEEEPTPKAPRKRER